MQSSCKLRHRWHAQFASQYDKSGSSIDHMLPIFSFRQPANSSCLFKICFWIFLQLGVDERVLPFPLSFFKFISFSSNKITYTYEACKIKILIFIFRKMINWPWWFIVWFQVFSQCTIYEITVWFSTLILHNESNYLRLLTKQSSVMVFSKWMLSCEWLYRARAIVEWHSWVIKD